MKKELDIRKEVAERKPKLPSKLAHFIYKVIMADSVMKKYKPVIKIVDNPKKCKTGCFLVFNHLSRIDHAYVLKATYPRRYAMVAGYNEFFRSHLHWVFEKEHIIPKKNYSNELQATKNMMNVVKSGGMIAFAPEGLASNDGQNKPVVPGTGKLFKHCKVPVYFLEQKGQYLQNTKVCLDERYGKTYATLKLLFTPEQLEVLTVEEIDNLMNEAFHQDEYLWQKEKHIKWETKGRICEDLHYLLYQCPKCGKLFTMEGHGNEIKCTSCGNGATVDDYYDFHPFENSVIPETQTEWVNNQRQNIINTIRENKEFSFTENVKLGILPNDHYILDKKTSEIYTEGVFKIDHSGVSFKSNNPSLNKYDFNLDYSNIFTTFTVWDARSFSFYVSGEYIEIFPDGPTTLYMNTLIEEMHRLHINYYKNFKWYDYMYENKELGIDKK